MLKCTFSWSGNVSNSIVCTGSQQYNNFITVWLVVKYICFYSFLYQVSVETSNHWMLCFKHHCVKKPHNKAPSSHWKAWLGLTKMDDVFLTLLKAEAVAGYRRSTVSSHTLLRSTSGRRSFPAPPRFCVLRWRSSSHLHFWSLLSHCNVTSDYTAWTHTYRYTQLPASHLFQTIKYKAYKKNTDRINHVGKGPSTLLLPWLQELNGGGGDDGFTGNRLRSDRMMNPPLLLFHTGSTTSCQIPFLSVSTVCW